jgi:hypothetical protein
MYYQFGRAKASETVAANMMTQMFPLTITLLVITFGYIVLVAPYRLHRKDLGNLHAEQEKCNAVQAQLNARTAPKVSLEFLEVTESPDQADAVYTATLLLTGLSQEPQKVELWCTDVKVQSPGSSTLSVITGEPGIKFIMHLGEKHRVDAVQYDWKTTEPGDLNILVPSKLAASNILRGKEFRIVFAAYGAMSPVELELLCFFRDDGRLHAEQSGAIKA